MNKFERFLSKSEAFILAIDGEAASGKGTLSKKIAENYNFFYCPTSILYRKLAKKSLEKKITKLDDLLSLALTLNDFKEDDSLYEEEISRKASELASIKEIREILNLHQRQILQNHKRILMEGRDIGTVIAPHADVKLYVSANIEIRAERRFKDQILKNPNLTLEEVKNDLIERDNRDKNRENAPMLIAEDAIILDSSNCNAHEFYEEAIRSITSKISC